MTVPSSMYRTCRTGRSLNVAIFTMEPVVKKEGRGRHPKTPPLPYEPRYSHRLKGLATLATAAWRNEDEDDRLVVPADDLVKKCRLFTLKRQSSVTFGADRVVRSSLRRGNC